MKILLFCPMNPNSPRLWRRTAESVLKIRWDDPIDYWLTANDNPHQEPYENITHQYNKARAMVLDGKYDALLTIESDMIVPPDTLKRLTACDSGVAYGLYVFRHTRHAWSAYSSITERSGRSLSEDADTARSSFGKVVDVEGIGLGCTLISRDVLERISFRLFDETPYKTACDWVFAYDCKQAGITQRCDLGVVCGHQTYKPYPMILWPDPTYAKLYRRETLEGVTMKQIQPGDQFYAGMGETVLGKAA